MSDAMRRELADWGVKVIMVLPGIMVQKKQRLFILS